MRSNDIWSEERTRNVTMRNRYYIAFGKWQFELVYLDDILICSKSSDEHIDHVLLVLT